MNERIRELMDEAVRFRLDPDSKQYEAQVSPEDLEAFAELIVRECCDVLQTETIRHDGYGYNQGALHQKIKQHFGVEK
jgi:hypothetical protein